MNDSKQFSLSNIDYKKILVGAGIALLGALATYLQDTIPSIDFGVYTPIIVAVNSIIINAIRKFIMGY
jgi:hypothetical protein